MRTAYKVWSGIAAGVFCLVATVDLAGGTPRLAPAASTSTAPAAAGRTSGTPVVTIDVAAQPGSASVVTGPVTRVVDGDTIEVAGERIRVLGIDACEIGTVGGEQAKDRAEALLGDRTVTLREEPGVDRDRYGRELRYVEADGRDFGLAMVAHPDTGVYQGRNDAAPAYVAQLRAADTDGRTCGGSSGGSGSSGSSGGSSSTHSSASPPAPHASTARPRPAVRAPAAASAYPNCAAARAAGVTPLLRGQPGYSSTLDRDGDGVACE